MAPVHLRLLRLPPTDGVFPSYKTAAAVQELLRRRLLDFKNGETSTSTAQGTRPNPTVISFTPQPTYTLGRRQASPSSSLSTAEINRLKAPLHIPKAQLPSPPDAHELDAPHRTFHPAVFNSPRGGLATYHGPGQVVLWPVMAINAAPPSSLGHKPFSVRCYSRLLEDTTIATLGAGGLRAFTTADPGVWVAGRGEGDAAGAPPPRKIAALGIHLRRHVSSLGVALNVDTPDSHWWRLPRSVLQWAPEAVVEEQWNPWARFVACGLEGKAVTCIHEEEFNPTADEPPEKQEALATIRSSYLMQKCELVARAWASQLAVGMGLEAEDLEIVESSEVEDIIDTAEREGWMDVVAKDEL